MINQTLRTGNNLIHFICRFSVAKRSSDSHACFWITIDDKPYYYNDLNTIGILPTGTVTINIGLKKGQVVKVMNDQSKYVYGLGGPNDMYSFFTGYMIAAWQSHKF